ncbi:MAG: helix-turn-helix domain-containing protein [Saprospiraceae bacterium]
MKNKIPETEADRAFYRQVGRRIRVFRQRAGYTQETFANQHDFDRSHYGECERGCNMTLQNLNRIITALDISFKQLEEDL